MVIVSGTPSPCCFHSIRMQESTGRTTRYPSAAMAGDQVDELRQRLLAQAWLYDNPEAYASGVEAALRAIAQLPAEPPAQPHRNRPAS
jgi:hypothetical protein